MTTPSLICDPELMIKSSAITLHPMVTGSVELLFIVPFSNLDVPFIIQQSPIHTFLMVPVLIMDTFSPIYPVSEDTSDA